MMPDLRYFQFRQILRVHQTNRFALCVHDNKIVNVFLLIVWFMASRKYRAAFVLTLPTPKIRISNGKIKA
jgi:hypothetical protein